MTPDSWKGMLFGLSTFAIFSFGDAIIKYETMSHPVLECVFFAEIGGLAALMVQAIRRGGLRRALTTKNPKIQTLRALCLGLEFILVLYAFSALPLALVYTLILSAPVLTAFFAPVFTSDRFNPRLLPVILIGFAGVVVAMHPGSVPVSLASLAALLSAFLFALGNFIVRRMEPGEPPLTFAFYPSLFALVVASGFMVLKQPALPPVTDILLMMVTGLCSVGGLTCLGRAMQLTQASRVMPFQYTQLVWGAIIGAAVFGEYMDAYMITGAGLILFSGLLLLVFGRHEGEPIAPPVVTPPQ
jgi:S-adenosylmethionine uptake transporter